MVADNWLYLSSKVRK